MSMSLSSASFQQSSSDNASLDTRKTLRSRILSLKKWAKTPNSTPNGWVLLILVTLSTVLFGTVYGVITLVEDYNTKICEARSIFGDANESNFLDLYNTVEELAGPDSRIPIIDLRNRMLDRTPNFDIEDC